MEVTTGALKSRRRAAKKRGASSQQSKGKNKKAKAENNGPSVNIPNDSRAGRFCLALELGNALVWEYLPCGDVEKLLDLFSAAFSREMLDMVALKVINTFAVENETHLGCHCECDWMRSLNFVPQTSEACPVGATCNLNMSLPIFQRPGGAQDLFHALTLTTKLLQLSSRHGGATFAPLVCPLPIKKEVSENHVKRAMNSICHNAGTRFFYDFKQKRGNSGYYADYLDYHWDGIEGSTCMYCENLSKPRKRIRVTTFQRFERVRANCAKLYRPLKAAMAKDLKFLRFVPRPRTLPRPRWETFYSGGPNPYHGLVAGVTTGGVLCGLYLEKGYCML